jgi:hypothetical protein
MTAFAGFKSLGDYIETRCRENGLSERGLTEALGKAHAYVHSIKQGYYKPSRKAADTIAAYFGDSPRIVRILAGLEEPPDDDAPLVAGIKEIATSLPKAGVEELLQFAKFLQGKYSKKS